jgi:uncharacterized protein YjbJ (UPF0337 family)
MEDRVLREKVKQLRSEAIEQWKHFTPDDVEKLDGKRDNLALLLQARYGFAKLRAQKEADWFLSDFADRLQKAS